MDVQGELLTSTVKLFFKRPPEVQKMLGRLLKTLLADGVDTSVRDRALLYFRLLRTSVKDASAVIGGDHAPVAEFHSEQTEDVKAAIWSEFNSLSVTYGKPSVTFISVDHRIIPLDAPTKAGTSTVAGAASDGDTLLSGMDGALPTSAAGISPSHKDMEDDLLGIGSSYSAATPGAGGVATPGGFMPVSVPYAATPSITTGATSDAFGFLGGGSPVPAPAPAPVFAFKAGVALDPASYQSKWTSLPVSQQSVVRASRQVSTTDVDALCRAANVLTIASGDVGTALKFYQFAGDATGAIHLFEVVFDKASSSFQVVLKSEVAATSPAALAAYTAALRPVLAM